MGQGMSEYRGEDNAPHFVLIEYCGGWGYYSYASAIADHIEMKYPKMFRILMRQDPDITGRLEGTLFWGTNMPGPEAKGIKFHSRIRGHGFANDHFKSFDKRLADAITKSED